MVPCGYDEVKISVISSRIIDIQYMYLYFVITNQFTYVVIHKRVKFHSEKYANKYNDVKHYMHEVIEPRYVFLFLK